MKNRPKSDATVAAELKAKKLRLGITGWLCVFMIPGAVSDSLAVGTMVLAFAAAFLLASYRAKKRLIEVEARIAERAQRSQMAPPPKSQEEQEEYARQLIEPHLFILRSRRRQLTKVDPYGRKDTSRWVKERAEFCASLLTPQMQSFKASRQFIDSMDTFVECVVSEEVVDNLPKAGTTRVVSEMDGREFEEYCATILLTNGWTVSLTSLSGDQGLDILARRDDVVLAVQCKRYSQPVGNGAVQEALAAKAFAGATHAAVVTNSSYTRSAVALAERCDVRLLHFSELPSVIHSVRDT